MTRAMKNSSLPLAALIYGCFARLSPSRSPASQAGERSHPDPAFAPDSPVRSRSVPLGLRKGYYAAVIGSTLLLSGCWQTVDTACTAFRPISYDAVGDTPETRTQVREHNAAWVALCR